MAILEADGLVAEHVPSPAGPIEAATLPLAPILPFGKLRTTLRFQRQNELMFRLRRVYGDVFRLNTLVHDNPITITSHPDHVRSLLTASPEDAPSVTGESPLRPIVGPSSVLTAVGPRHMRQRKLLLPPFHGEAVARYSDMIRDAAEKEVDTWSAGETLEIAPRMQAVTLDVIMSGIFGVAGEAGTEAGQRLRVEIRKLAELSVSPLGQLGELLNTGSNEPVGLVKLALKPLDKAIHAIIAERRGQAEETNDILSLLMRATTEEGEHLTDAELRDELVGLVLAGHETTANQLAWTFERLVRTPDAYDALRSAVRDDDDAAAWFDATLKESQRSRPVVQFIGRRVKGPWQFGEYALPAGTLTLVSIM
ncbi:MAG: hypothetical protein QOF76_4159, partial [Solirubrobacteraceae bacterium]|nr:hypothetical protein [Solirubrobacteraceae bacterium]